MSKVVITATIAPIVTVQGALITPNDCVADNGVEYIATRLPDGSTGLYNPASGNTTVVESTKFYEVIAGTIGFSDVAPTP